MSRTFPTSARAGVAREVVEGLQTRFGAHLSRIGGAEWTPVHWLRDEGRHGGGTRLVAAGPAYDRGSINVSVVHYDDVPDKRLASATALSTIVHPRPPRAPSTHVHISYTELRDGRGMWRLMADLNPSLPDDTDATAFRDVLRASDPALFDDAAANGDRYFTIPALDRHRGVVHYYLEGHATDDFDADAAFARSFGEAILDAYAAILEPALQRPARPGDADAQRAYHTLYLFQVLTLDRGTTSGILVHDQNDVGILGSLPSRVDVGLLRSWRQRLPALQQPLLDGIVSVLEPDGVVGDVQKAALAQVVRHHYRAHPDALALQARGAVLPTTVANHR